MDEVRPRENVLTFNAWKALGRVMKKGQHGVKIVTVISCTKKDRESGEQVLVKKVKTTTVFHVSQTEDIDGEPTPEQEPSALQEASAAPEAAQATAETPAGEMRPEAAEPRPMNVYEVRQEAARERYADRAAA